MAKKPAAPKATASAPPAVAGRVKAEDEPWVARWRLALGRCAEERGLTVCDEAGRQAQEAIDYVFQDERSAGAGESPLTVPRWIDSVSELFPRQAKEVLERTLVDLLHAPRRGGGREEVWRSLALVPFFDLDAIAAHALALGSALTTARVGYFLEQHRASLMAEERHLATLRAHAPRQPRYFDARRSSGTLVPGWNLIVPDDVQGRTWAEVS